MLNNKGNTATLLRATAGQLMPSTITLSVAANAIKPGTVLRALQRLRRPLLPKSAAVAVEVVPEFLKRCSDVKRRASLGAVFVVSMKRELSIECDL